MLARFSNIVRHPNRRRRHDFNGFEIAPRLLCAFFHESYAPGDQVRIGKLKNHSVCDPSGYIEHFWPIARNPYGRRTLGPSQPGGLPVILDFPPGSKLAELLDRFFQLRRRYRLFAENSSRAVATPDTWHHPAARSQVP